MSTMSNSNFVVKYYRYKSLSIVFLNIFQWKSGFTSNCFFML